MKSLAGAFDKLGGNNTVLATIAENTQATATSLAVGGEFYTRMDAMATAVEDIRDGKGGKKGMGSLANSMAIALLAPSMEPLGKGLQFVVDAVNNLEGTGEETKAKMEALAGGLTLLGDVGKSILKFAATMVLATPLLMVAVLGTPLIALTLKALIWSINWATKNLDKESLEKTKMMGDVGKSILILAGTLALASLIAPMAVKGAFLGALLIGGLALIISIIPDKILDQMERFGNTLLDVALGLLAFTVTFALISLIAGAAIKGAILSIFIVGGIAIVFAVLQELGVIDEMEKVGKGLLFAGLAILGLGISLALFNLVIPGFFAVTGALLTVMGVGLAFMLIGIFSNEIESGAKSMLWVSLSILALGFSLWIFSKVIGNISGEDAAKSFGALLVIGLLAAGFLVIGLGESFIKKGAIAMILVGASLIVIGIGFMIITKALGDNPWPMIGATLALITGLGLVFGIAGAGPVPAFIALGAGAMILAGVALILVGAGIAAIAASLKGGKAAILNDEENGLVPTFTAIGDALIMWPWRAAGILLGAGAMTAAGIALISIGLGLKQFVKISKELDLPTLGADISLMIGTLAVPFHKIGAGEWMEVLGANGEKTWVKFGGGGGGLFGLGSKNTVAMGIQSTLSMGKALSGIAKGVQNMANLKFPTAFDKEGNPTAYETIGGDAFKKVITNTMMMVGALAVPFAKIGMGGEQKIIGPDGNEMTVDFGKPSAGGLMGFLTGGGSVQKGIKAVMNMGEALSNIAGGVQDMALLKFPTGFDAEGKVTGYRNFDAAAAEQVTANTEMLVGALGGTFAKIGSNPDANDGSWWGGKSTIEKGIAIVTGIGEPLLNLAKGVEAMAKLKFPIYDKDGKITGYTSIADAGSLKAKIKNNTIMLIQALTDALITIGKDNPDASSSWWQGSTAFEDGIEVMTMIGEPYKVLGESIKDIIDIVGKLDSKAFAGKIKDIIGVFTSSSTESDAETLKQKSIMTATIGATFEKMGSAIPGIISAVNSYDPTIGEAFFGALIRPTDEGARAEGYAKQATLWATIGANVVRMGESMPSITESINNMDLAKLTEMRTMFEALGVLSNGAEPSDILAAMGESLEEALQNLATMLEEFKGSVEAGAAAQTETGGIIGNAIKSFTGGGQKDTSGGSGNSAEVVAAINQLQTTLVSSGIKVKKSGGWFD